jgi:uncharacterized repeat protein (TIGR01451 family)
MKLIATRLRALAGGRRTAIVVGVFLLVALTAGVGSVMAGAGADSGVRRDVEVPRAPVGLKKAGEGSVIVGRSYKNDRSRPLRLIPAKPIAPRSEREGNRNPSPVSQHKDALDTVRQSRKFAPNMPGRILNFDGIVFPGVNCNCAPPDTNGEVGATQYVQMVNQGFQVFNKTTGASVFGPADIATVWTGFGGVCENDAWGDPVVVYDQLASRWVISQFAGFDTNGAMTDECIAVSTGSDATGTWNRYAFHLGTDFFDYPHLGVWPDAYYMTMNVFNAAGTAFLGPQPFALDRAAMLAGNPATFVTTRNAAVFSPSNDAMLPGDLDGSSAPPAGAPNPFLMSGTAATWKLWRYHVDFGTPANSTFTLGGNLTPASYTELCPGVRECVPQAGVSSSSYLDGLGDRGMFRLAYRNFGDHEALVGNQSVSAGGVAGIRWYEINNATSGTPAFAQQSTYQPDSTWRWMGSAAMDQDGNLAVGFSASSPTINPQIRYAGRLAGDPANSLAQGEAHLFNGTGSQQGTGNRWGDYSDLTVDPVDDCTFWYTNEYYQSTGTFNWRTRIGSFKFPSCSPSAGTHLSIDKTADAASVNSGSQIGFTVTLTNSGTDPATGVAVTDNLPSGTGINWVVDPSGTTGGWSISGSPPNQRLVAPSTVPGATELHVHVVSNTTNASCGTYNNTATITGGGSGTASSSTAVICTPTCAGLSEGFNNVGSLPGWFKQNNSSPLGATGWFQGDPGAFEAQAGAPNSYIAANYQNAAGDGTISNWLLTPVLSLHNGAQVVFWTRKITETGPFFPDRLQVRMSTNGASTNVGSTATSVGSFTTLLLDINPTYANGGYPFDWTQYTLTLSGLSGTISGRIAFRYFVENGGPLGANSDYIGIDTACLPALAPPPPPPPPPPPSPPPPPPPPHSLAVSKAGTGSGTVTSSPAGISCGATCVATFPSGTTVTLTATRATGSRFTGWSGDCAGTATTCQLTMTADRLAVATFAKVVRCVVPKTVGLRLKKARARIVRAHCRVGKVTKKFSTRRKKGRVLSQKPKPGRRLVAGARVNLVVGKGPRP